MLDQLPAGEADVRRAVDTVVDVVAGGLCPAAPGSHSRLMEIFNLLEGELADEEREDGWRLRSARVGDVLGAARIGGSVYELGDGQRDLPVPLPPRGRGVAGRARG